jgi:peptidoglycan hydrolase-like protein with peptidoglycan-binding domain
VDAVMALQKESGLPETGFVDRATAAALDAAVVAKQSSAASEAVATAAAVQSTLKLAGHWDGPVDGQWTEELTDALKAFQSELGVSPSGEVDAATLNALQRAIADAKSAATSTTAPPTTERSVTTDVPTTMPT